MSTMAMKPRSSNHISCQVSPEYSIKLITLQELFVSCRVREVVPENGKASMTKCIFI